MTPTDLLSRFQRRPDGTWLCLEEAVIETPGRTVTVPAGARLVFGDREHGIDVAEYLEQLGAQFGS